MNTTPHLVPEHLPFPTKTRLGLMCAIGLKQVIHYWTSPPWSYNAVVGEKVTARVAELLQAGLVVVPQLQKAIGGWDRVEPTDAGRRWFQQGAGAALVECVCEGRERLIVHSPACPGASEEVCGGAV